ncbi:MAG: hypothetical protein WBG92_24545 [Thiohalocapsa sp.]
MVARIGFRWEHLSAALIPDSASPLFVHGIELGASFGVQLLRFAKREQLRPSHAVSSPRYLGRITAEGSGQAVPIGGT